MAVALLAGLAPAQAQTTNTRPAGCDPASLGQYWGYQYDANVRRTWDSYNQQYASVCVKNTPGPPSGCGVSVQNPWYTASGNPSTGPLCWYGTRDVPVRSATNPPAGCFPTALTARAAYTGDANVKALWDRYSSETLGVCESLNQYPDDCKYRVQEFASKWLCWWPHGLNASPLHAIVDRRGLEDVANTFLAIQAICDFVGTGRVAFEFRIGHQTVQMLVQNCRITDVQFLTPPDGCVEVNPFAYTIISRDRINSALANSKGVCRMARSPVAGECNDVIQLTPQIILCFWGKPGGKQANAFFTDSPRFSITASLEAFRAILNAGDRGDTAKRLVAGGYIAINGMSVADHMKLRLAFQKLGDLVPVEPLTSGHIRFEYKPGQLVQIEVNPKGGFFGYTPRDTFVINQDGAPTGVLSPNHARYAGIVAFADFMIAREFGEDLSEWPEYAAWGQLSQPTTTIQGFAGYVDRLWADEWTAEFGAQPAQPTDPTTGDRVIRSLDPAGGLPPAENFFSFPVTQPDGTVIWVGPPGKGDVILVPTGAPTPTAEPSVDDLIPYCPVICSLDTSGDPMTTGPGQAFTQGAGLGHLSSAALLSAGLGLV